MVNERSSGVRSLVFGPSFPAGPAPTPEHTATHTLIWDLFSDVKHLPTRVNMWWAIAGGAGALAVHPANTRITASFTNASWTKNHVGAS
jgi:hypothetical protein